MLGTKCSHGDWVARRAVQRMEGEMQQTGTVWARSEPLAAPKLSGILQRSSTNHCLLISDFYPRRSPLVQGKLTNPCLTRTPRPLPPSSIVRAFSLHSHSYRQQGTTLSHI